MAVNAGRDIGRRARRWRIAAWGTAALLLVLPLVAMQFTDEVDWDVAAHALFVTALAQASVAAAALIAGLGLPWSGRQRS